MEPTLMTFRILITHFVSIFCVFVIIYGRSMSGHVQKHFRVRGDGTQVGMPEGYWELLGTGNWRIGN